MLILILQEVYCREIKFNFSHLLEVATSMDKQHCLKYQLRDHELIDYQMYRLGETDLWLRGPDPGIANLERGKYIVCIGAAQTFGTFCERPFPILLEESLNLPVLNLGFGGAGPSSFLRHPELFDYINGAKFVIVQVMSARSESNSLFEANQAIVTRRFDGRRLANRVAYDWVLEGGYLWKKIPIGQQYFREFAKLLGKLIAKKIVTESRNNWIDNYRYLLSKIEVPKILFWFSTRNPDYQMKYTNVMTLYNEFPMLVNLEMVDKIKDLCNNYVECVSNRETPQPLFVSRFTGEPVTVDGGVMDEVFKHVWKQNIYYPSPEMHSDAAEVLFPICHQYLSF
jgi:hypothetical protein